MRNSPSLIDALTGGEETLFHFDGEFASAEELVRETFLGRNFGWLPQERGDALAHVATILRSAPLWAAPEQSGGELTYAAVLEGRPSVPAALRLPPSLTLDVAKARDEELLDACARLMVAFLRSLRSSRDAGGLHDGSPYDAFLAANRLPRGPAAGQAPADYGRRVGEQLAGLKAPRWIDEPARRLREHDQAFRFGERELEGARIFFRGAVGAAQATGAGNCAECHVPPHFSDFQFHNTGSAQDDYDALHGAGSFNRLLVPSLAQRAGRSWRCLSRSFPSARIWGCGISTRIRIIRTRKAGFSRSSIRAAR